jgi:hypothetical protein
MTWIFFASVALFTIAYGKCRQWLMAANKAALTAKNRYHANATTYLDDWNTGDADALHSSCKLLDNESVLRLGNDNRCL